MNGCECPWSVRARHRKALTFESTMCSAHSTVGRLMPEFAQELQRLIAAADRPELVGQVVDLPIVDRCRCGQDNCATFHTAPRPEGAYPPGHDCVMLDPDTGLVILDLVENQIVCVEVLDRPDVKELLDQFMPT